jgi:hypothetical protein
VQVCALLEGVTAADMLASWHDILASKMEEWRLDRGELVELFGGTRDVWMQEDLQGWLAPNEIYEGVAEPLDAAMKADDTEVYIVTTKQVRACLWQWLAGARVQWRAAGRGCRPLRKRAGAKCLLHHALPEQAHTRLRVQPMQERFTKAILQQMAGIEFPLERIFSSTVSGQPKSEVLEMLQGRHDGLVCHFVEDKLSTLQKVMKVDALKDVKLYLVDWGYNTDDEKDFARSSDRIELINHQRFGELLTS